MVDLWISEIKLGYSEGIPWSQFNYEYYGSFTQIDAKCPFCNKDYPKVDIYERATTRAEARLEITVDANCWCMKFHEMTYIDKINSREIMSLI